MVSAGSTGRYERMTREVITLEDKHGKSRIH